MSDKDEMLKMFGLKDKSMEYELSGVPLPLTDKFGDPIEVNINSDLPDTVYKLDEWDRARGEQIIPKHEAFKVNETSTEAASDFFAAAFLPEPEMNETCSDPLRMQFLNEMSGTSEYAVLRKDTVFNAVQSALAAASFAESYGKLQRDRTACWAHPSVQKRAEEKSMDVLLAAGKAVQKAQEEVEEATEWDAGLGHGIGGDGTHLNERLTPKDVANRYHRIKNDPKLRKIMELAGKYRRLARAKQRRKYMHGYDDMVGVELAGEIGRALPVELGRLGMEEFELDSLRRIVERQVQCREHHSVDGMGKGPIVVTVDESGSMSGDKVMNAKAFALAIAWVAGHQKRWCCLVGYSGNDRGKHNTIVLKPGKWNEEALMDWLVHFYSGGSGNDIPTKEMPDIWHLVKPPKGKTDIIMVTDAERYAHPEADARFREFVRSVDAKVIGLLIDNPYGGDSIKSVADEVIAMNNIDVSEEGIQKCLSI